jgi:hypothetical protein
VVAEGEAFDRCVVHTPMTDIGVTGSENSDVWAPSVRDPAPAVPKHGTRDGPTCRPAAQTCRAENQRKPRRVASARRWSRWSGWAIAISADARWRIDRPRSSRRPTR